MEIDTFDTTATSLPGKCWVAVASADHVRRGVEQSIMQVCHGKAAPLRRVSPGDRVAYYSPSTAFRGADKLQAFTAYGRVMEGEPYAHDKGGGFRPFRRDVAWECARATTIRPLLVALAFTSGDRNRPPPDASPSKSAPKRRGRPRRSATMP